MAPLKCNPFVRPLDLMLFFAKSEGELKPEKGWALNECTEERWLFCPHDSLHLCVELRWSIQDLYQNHLQIWFSILLQPDALSRMAASFPVPAELRTSVRHFSSSPGSFSCLPLLSLLYSLRSFLKCFCLKNCSTCLTSKKVHENIIRVYMSFMRREYHFQPEIANLKASNQLSSMRPWITKAMRSSSADLTRGTTERAFPGCGVVQGTAHFSCFGLTPQPASRSLFEIIVVDTIRSNVRHSIENSRPKAKAAQLRKREVRNTKLRRSK